MATQPIRSGSVSNARRAPGEAHSETPASLGARLCRNVKFLGSAAVAATIGTTLFVNALFAPPPMKFAVEQRVAINELLVHAKANNRLYISKDELLAKTSLKEIAPKTAQFIYQLLDNDGAGYEALRKMQKEGYLFNDSEVSLRDLYAAANGFGYDCDDVSGAERNLVNVLRSSKIAILPPESTARYAEGQIWGSELRETPPVLGSKAPDVAPLALAPKPAQPPAPTPPATLSKAAKPEPANLPCVDLTEMIKRISEEEGGSAALTRAVIRAESDGREDAVSVTGAQGLMQLMPVTQGIYGVENPYDPEQNIRGGVRYLRYLSERFHGDLDLVLAGYNAGPTKVAKLGRVPRIRETIRYVAKVKKFLAEEEKRSEGALAVTLACATPAPAKKA